MSPSNFFNEILEGDIDVESEEAINLCLRRFDQDEDGVLNMRELMALLEELFVNSQGESYKIPARMAADIFFAFDVEKDAKLDLTELKNMWEVFLIPVIKPKTALVIIDVQNDFIDGSLAIRNCPAGQEGKDVVDAINQLLESVTFDYVVYTYDWHPEDHVSFIENVHLRKLDESSPIPLEEVKKFDTVVFEGPPKFEQKLWPRHCVQNSWGAELHGELTIAEDAIFIYKGTSSDIDSYSAFWDNQRRSETNLSDELKSRGVTDVYITGLATDYCVGCTALDALENGYRTVLVEDACRGVQMKDIKATLGKLKTNHAVIVSMDQVEDMVAGRDRRPELGYRTAMLSQISF